MRLLSLLFFLLVSLTASQVQAQLLNECGGNASIEGASYLVRPSGGDDTSTLQCVLDSATQQGIEKITLAAGQFFISQIRGQDFVGTFEGASRSTTLIDVIDGSLVCNTSGGSIAAIQFFDGDVRVRFFTLTLNQPCAQGDEFVGLGFSMNSCSARTYFTEIDRINLRANALVPGTSAGITSGAPPDCVAQGANALGTFKLNRSSVSGFTKAVRTLIAGAGQVDINFNEFIDVANGVEIENANQSTTITGNTIFYNTKLSANNVGVGVFVVTSSESAPTANRTVIHKNTFVQGASNAFAYAVGLNNQKARANQSAVVTNNDITASKLNGGFVYLMDVVDIDGALVANNTFRGGANVGVLVGSFDFPQASRNNVVTGNNFLVDTDLSDVWLLEGAEATLVGDQNEVTQDDGVGNFVLSSGIAKTSRKDPQEAQHFLRQYEALKSR